MVINAILNKLMLIIQKHGSYVFKFGTVISYYDEVDTGNYVESR